MSDYVDKITHRPNAAFELAIKQQYAAAVDNERRAPARTIPNFKPHDFLYIWARSSKEQFAQESNGKKTALPRKWVNPWVGPFEMIRWQGNRYCVLNYRGKEKAFSVDRLSKHQQWDEIRPDTYKWQLQAQKQEMEQKHLLKGAYMEENAAVMDDERGPTNRRCGCFRRQTFWRKPTAVRAGDNKRNLYWKERQDTLPVDGQFQNATG